MGLLEPMHLVVILGIAFLVFGPKRLPELGKGLGESIRGFKKAIAGGTPDAEARVAGDSAEEEKSKGLPS
jgi:sec-independent protein translocase protein TatA